MTEQDAMRSGFTDELEKIAGELQGFTRSGRKPIGIERMLEREVESEETPSALFGPVKLSSIRKLADLGKYKLPAAMIAGAGGYRVAQKANEDRKLGRQVRLQQG